MKERASYPGVSEKTRGVREVFYDVSKEMLVAAAKEGVRAALAAIFS